MDGNVWEWVFSSYAAGCSVNMGGTYNDSYLGIEVEDVGRSVWISRKISGSLWNINLLPGEVCRSVYIGVPL